MFSLPSWPARTTHLRWSTELSRNTTWRISAVRISASARLSNVAKVVWAQRKFTHKYWPVFFFFCPHLFTCLFSFHSSASELQIPDKANVFYAMCTSSNYDFVLRQRWRSYRRCFGSSSSPGDAAKTRFAKWKMPERAEYVDEQLICVSRTKN